MKILLFDTIERKRLFPLTLTRAVADLRLGIFTIKEWWNLKTGLDVRIYTDEYLQPLYSKFEADDYLLINSHVLFRDEVINQVLSLQTGEAISDDIGLIAGRISLKANPTFGVDFSSLFTNPIVQKGIERLISPVQIFKDNDLAIRKNFDFIAAGRMSQPISATNKIIKTQDIFIEEGASVECSILNASTGPIYIGRNAVVMEGCMIRGPFAMCESAVLKMGAKVYGATTIGPHCTAGGEIKNSVLTGYSNKAHDGYLGDSVIGEWCNLGAGTSNSNVKNTGGTVQLWNYYDNKFVASGIKCGLIMGDYSRTAINTSINTGSLIGVCCNVFGEGLTPKIIENFTWGQQKPGSYKFDKALIDIANWKRMKNRNLEEAEVNILKYIFDK